MNEIQRLFSALLPEETTEDRTSTDTVSAIEAAAEGIREEVDELLAHDPGVRLGLPEAAHKMRSAARHIRSVLAGNSKLFRKRPVQNLRDELKWLADAVELGPAGDADAAMQRLSDGTWDYPSPSTGGPNHDAVDYPQGRPYGAAYGQAYAALRSARYYALIDALGAFCANPPVKPKAAARQEHASGGPGSDGASFDDEGGRSI
jgi:hypothetical protein